MLTYFRLPFGCVVCFFPLPVLNKRALHTFDDLVYVCGGSDVCFHKLEMFCLENFSVDAQREKSRKVVSLAKGCLDVVTFAWSTYTPTDRSDRVLVDTVATHVELIYSMIFFRIDSNRSHLSFFFGLSSSSACSSPGLINNHFWQPFV